jgi:hypothetical protein
VSLLCALGWVRTPRVPVHGLIHGPAEIPRLFACEVVRVGLSDCAGHKPQHQDWQKQEPCRPVPFNPPPRPGRLVRRLTKSKLHSQSSVCRLRKLHIVREPPPKGNSPQRCGGTEVRPPENRALRSRQSWFCRQVSRRPWAHGPGCKRFRRLRYRLGADKSPLTFTAISFSSI